MSIEIYDKARIVKKGDTYHYLVKWGSKNCFTCPWQHVIGDDLHDRYLQRETRDSDWHCVATSNERDWKDNTIALTVWNCPTSYVCGRIRFGNGKNIALYFAKKKERVTTDYNDLDEEQQKNVDKIITWEYSNRIDLGNIPEEKKGKSAITYCGNTFIIGANLKTYAGQYYWDLDNL